MHEENRVRLAGQYILHYFLRLTVGEDRSTEKTIRIVSSFGNLTHDQSDMS